MKPVLFTILASALAVSASPALHARVAQVMGGEGAQASPVASSVPPITQEGPQKPVPSPPAASSVPLITQEGPQKPVPVDLDPAGPSTNKTEREGPQKPVPAWQRAGYDRDAKAPLQANAGSSVSRPYRVGPPALICDCIASEDMVVDAWPADADFQKGAAAPVTATRTLLVTSATASPSVLPAGLRARQAPEAPSSDRFQAGMAAVGGQALPFDCPCPWRIGTGVVKSPRREPWSKPFAPKGAQAPVAPSASPVLVPIAAGPIFAAPKTAPAPPAEATPVAPAAATASP
ncbi:MAG: hypothetical protein M1825_003508 [Sarcosagium campestre]|nr:MAG: hypothetical protein M1825_003508 [Sarcosagium campestre]